MKRKFTLLLTAVLMLMSGLVWGQTRDEVVAYTLDGTVTGGSSGYADASEITQDGLTWMVTGNTTMNPWRIGGKSLSGVDRPLYSTGTISDNITKIVVTHGTAANITVNSMTLVVSANDDFSNPTSTLTGDFAASSTTTFNRPSGADWSNKYFKIVYNVTVTQTSNKFVQFISAEFYKENGGMESVVTPTFSPEAGTYTTTQNVTISCATTGATIYYTTDGTAPTTSSTVYSTPIAISETTTVKAMGVKAGMSNSNVATAVYNFPVVYANIAAWKADHIATNSTVSSISGDLTAVYQNGNSLYVQDATGGLLIYGNVGKTYNNGDVISGGISGTSTLYSGTIEFIPTSTFPDGVAGTAVQPIIVTAEEVIDNYDTYAGRLVKMEGITFNANHTFATNNSTGRTTTFTQNGTQYTCFDSFKVLAGFVVTEGQTADITGLIGCYNTTRQIFPRSTEDIAEPIVVTYYTVNIAEGIANGTVTVDTTLAVEGATINVTAIPDNNYELATLTYTYSGVAAPIDIDQTTMQFVMPAADVTINATFSLIPSVATPTFSPEAGEYTEAQNVTISCATEGATIYYTLDGTDPMVTAAGIDGTLYTEALSITETTTVKAIAVKPGMLNSEIATAVYTITIVPPATLTFNKLVNHTDVVADGVYMIVDTYSGNAMTSANGSSSAPSAVPVTITGDSITGVIDQTLQWNITAVEGGYKINPVSDNTNFLYTTATNNGVRVGENTNNVWEFNITDATQTDYLGFKNVGTSRFLGVYNNQDWRAYTTVNNNIKNTSIAIFVLGDVPAPSVPDTVAIPIFSPEAGEYTEAQNVTISCATEGATIYYTLDGTDPTTNSTVYINSIVISDTTTVKAFAVKEGWIDSEIATAVYTITIIPPTPTLTFNKLFSHNDVVADGIYMIVDTYSGRALTSANGTNSAPTAVEVTIENDAITGEIEEILQWNITAVEGGYKINPVGDTVNYLYTTTTNNGVRVGTNANNVWEFNITDTTVTTYKGFKNTATNRYLGVYNNADWRTYTTIHNNIKNTNIEIFVLGDAPIHTFYAVNVAATTNGTVTVSDTLAEAGTIITVTAEPAQGYELATLTYSYTGATPIDIMATKQFTMPSSDVTVNATFTELAHVASPTFTPATGSYIQGQLVSIACTEPGATIYYTLDGTEPTIESTVYTGPFTVSTTTTVKALAVKEGMNNSDVVTATYTIIEPMTIAAAKALSNNEYALVQGVVTFIDGRNVYVQDETAGIDLYLNSNTVPSTLALGDMVLGYGKKTVYNGLVELTSIAGNNTNQFVILSNGNELPLAEKTIAEILADNQSGANLLQSTRVQIVNATIGTINTSSNTPITQDESTLNIYKMPVVEGLEQGDFVTVIGIIGCYNAPQLRVSSANDVEFTHPAGIFVTPASLAGFNYVYEEGPSTVKSFAISARSLTSATHIVAPENYELSSFPGNNFYPENHITINTYTGTYNYTIKVRLKAGLEIGSYDENITIYQDEVDTMYVALSGSVTGQPQPSAEYVRVTDLSQLGNGSKVIFAARYNENASEYFAMTAQTSGKPEGVLFTSVIGTDAETLPSEITDAESTYYWTVTTDETSYTFTNAEGNVLGYTSSTNFATGGDNTAWAITFQTSEATAMVPEYSAFVINNVNNAVRAFALNSNHNFGPYHTQNIAAENYNFFIDIFASGESGTPTCAVPTFEPEGGTYFEEQTVTISCGTPDATIYYTLDGSDPTINSMVYAAPIDVAENMTIKAFAVKEGFNDSNIAEAEYTIILGAVTIFSQDWEGDMNGWTFVTVEGSKPWAIGQYQGNHYANANGYNGGVNEQWCISPAFNLDMYDNESLSFRNAMKFTGPDMELFFSNNYDGENPTTATWTALEYVMSEGNYVWAESGAISLADFTGTSCYIGFKYTSTETEAASWEIDDITLIGFTSDPVLTVTPLNLTGFSYVEGNGPSAEQSFLISGFNLTENIILTIDDEAFEMSSTTGEDFDPIDEYEIEPNEGSIEEIVYVRMAEGLEVGSHTATITVDSELDDITVTLNGTVIEPVQGGDWNRIGSLADLQDGDQVIIASRYDATVGEGYYAMTAGVSGKPDGVLFTSINENGIEMLPDEITADANTFLWNVTVSDTIITLVNAAGDTLGYSSSTNFAGNTSTNWSIAYATSGDNAMVPNYTGFVITNVETNNRCIVMNASHKFGAYHTNNINNADYNFYLDLFVQGGTATQTVATPVFSVASGTFFEEFDVEITCATEGATIYYTNDGSEPTAESTVYEGAIHVDSDITLKAIAMMEGYESSGIATVNYTVITGQSVILNQDWEDEMNGWTFVTVEGNKPWSIGTYGGNKYAYANGYNDDIDNEQWCISPSFNLTYFTNVVLTFRNAMKFTGPDMQLLFSTDYDGTNISAATWTELDYVKSEGNYTWTESGEILLDGIRSSNCHIAFLYTSTLEEGAAAWEVDDILVIGTAYDAVEETTVSDVNFWNYDNEIFVENQTNGNVQMTVFNLIGQQVFTKTLSSGNTRFSHNLANGLYVVTLQNSKGRMSVKMIVK